MHANYLEDKTASQTCYCVVGPDRTQIANVLQQCVRPRLRASHDDEHIIEDPHPKSDAEKLVSHRIWSCARPPSVGCGGCGVPATLA